VHAASAAIRVILKLTWLKIEPLKIRRFNIKRFNVKRLKFKRLNVSRLVPGLIPLKALQTLHAQIFILIICTSSITFAQNSSRPSLSLKSAQYISQNQSYFRSSAKGENQSLALSVAEDFKWDSQWGARLQLNNEWSASEEWNYLDVDQAYVEWRPPSYAVKMQLGRRLEAWNEWEASWRQGVVQPRHFENKLRPEFAGLTGLFATLGEPTSRWSGAVAFLPVLIPEFGPHFEIKNGEFASANPWFQPPAQQFRFREQTGDLRYRVAKPPTQDIVANPGLMAKVEYRSSPSNVSRISLGYKPMEQLFLAFPSQGTLHLNDVGEHIEIELHPRVVYHGLVSVDQMGRWGSWLWSLSALHETPVDRTFARDWTAQSTAPAWVYAASLSRPIEAAKISLSVLKVVGGDDRDRGKLTGQQTLFERRYQYLEALRVSLSWTIHGWMRYPIESEFSGLYDRMQNGGVFSSKVTFNWTRQWRTHFELDVLGLVGPSAPVQDGFLSSYRANDRVGVGMSYVF